MNLVLWTEEDYQHLVWFAWELFCTWNGWEGRTAVVADKTGNEGNVSVDSSKELDDDNNESGSVSLEWNDGLTTMCAIELVLASLVSLTGGTCSSTGVSSETRPGNRGKPIAMASAAGWNRWSPWLWSSWFSRLFIPIIFVNTIETPSRKRNFEEHT